MCEDILMSKIDNIKESKIMRLIYVRREKSDKNA